MTDHSPPADDPRRIATLALLMAYGQTDDPAAQAEILRSLARQAGAADLAQGRDRLRDWMAGLPPPELADSPDYARYEDLLPQMLAGLLPADHPDHAWFQTFLARSEWAAEEYADLQQALVAEQAARRGPSDVRILRPALGAPPQPLLAVAEPGGGSPETPAADAAWGTPIRAERLILRRQGDRLRQVEVQFARDPTTATPDPAAPPAPTKELLAGPLPPEPGLDPAQHYNVTVLAVGQGGPTCTLRVQISDPTPTGIVPVRARSARGQEWSGFTTAQGVVEFAAVPVAALDGLLVLIDLDRADSQPRPGAV